MARTLPPMMQVMRDVGGVEIPETLANLGAAVTKPHVDVVAAPPPDAPADGRAQPHAAKA